MVKSIDLISSPGIITISEDEDDDTDSVIFIEEKVKPRPNETNSDNENEAPNEQEILKGLQEKIQTKYMNSTKTFVHDTEHNHDHLVDKDKPFEFTYLGQIPFSNQTIQSNSQESILNSLPEVPIAQDKLLNDQVETMLANYKRKELSEQNCQTEYSYEKDSDSMLRPLKKRRLKY